MKPIWSVPKTPHLFVDNFIPISYPQKKSIEQVSSLRRLIARAICTERRHSFSGRPGTTGMKCDSRRGTNCLDWTTKSILAAIGRHRHSFRLFAASRSRKNAASYPNVLLIYVLSARAWEFRLGRIWFNGDWLLLDRDGVFDYRAQSIWFT